MFLEKKYVHTYIKYDQCEWIQGGGESILNNRMHEAIKKKKINAVQFHPELFAR